MNFLLLAKSLFGNLALNIQLEFTCSKPKIGTLEKVLILLKVFTFEKVILNVISKKILQVALMFPLLTLNKQILTG